MGEPVVILGVGDPCPYCGRPITWVDHLPGLDGEPIRCNPPVDPATRRRLEQTAELVDRGLEAA